MQMADRYVIDKVDERRPVSEIVQNIANNLQEIVRAEFRLAKTELTERGRNMGRAAAILGAGVLLLAIAGLLLVATIVAALSLFMPVWAAALIVAIVLGALGAGMALVGRERLKKSNLRPDDTIESVKEDVEWLKRQTR
jgi:uncharacterized membrane protein YqjE